MKNKKCSLTPLRILCLLLSALFFATTLFACTGNGEGKETIGEIGNSSGITGGDTLESDTMASDSKDYSYISDLPKDLNYGNETINIICRDELGVSDELFAEADESNSLIAMAVYDRNRSVEEKLGVKLNIILQPDDGTNVHHTINAKVLESILASDRNYDIVAAPFYTLLSSSGEGNFRNLKDSDYLNLDKRYWAQNFNDIACIGEAQYLATGMIALSIYRYMYVTVYNNVIFENYKIPDLFDIVLANEWTIDKQYEIASAFKGDVNTYGFVSGCRTSVDAYVSALDMSMLARDENNFYYYDVNYDRLSSAVDKILALYYNCEGSYIVEYGRDNTDNADILSLFSASKAAMANMKVQTIEYGLREFGDEYSIVPMPKYDENQEYLSYIQDQVTVFALPKDIYEDEAPMIEAVLECLAAESYKYVYTAYYEKALSYRYLQNEQSVEMLDIIYNSASVIEGAFSGAAMNVVLRSIISGKQNTIVQTIESSIESYRYKLNEVNIAYGLPK